MKKTCEKCGRTFEAYQSHHRLCTSCHGHGSARVEPILPSELLLKSYYDSDLNLVKEVFIDVPEQLSKIFVNGRPALGRGQLRDFYMRIAKARNRSNLKGIASAKALLYKCQADLDYQLERGVVPKTFVDFMKHHLQMAEKDKTNLEGFYQHLDCIQCYFPIKKDKEER